MPDQPTKVTRYYAESFYEEALLREIGDALTNYYPVILATDYDDLRNRVATVLREADARYDETFAHGFLAGWNASQQENLPMLKVQQTTLAEAVKLVTQRTKQIDELLKEIDP